jgi:hypothetical protein
MSVLYYSNPVLSILIVDYHVINSRAETYRAIDALLSIPSIRVV